MSAPPSGSTKRSTSVWKQGVVFEHQTEGSVAYRTDAPLGGKQASELEGPTPMETVLGAVAGCTGVDIVTMLGKMRLTLRDLRIEVTADRADDHPRIFNRIHLDYHIETDPRDMKKVHRAVALSAAKYCSVSAMLAGVVDLSYTLHHAGEQQDGVMHEGHE